jgi:hypothetical protein
VATLNFFSDGSGHPDYKPPVEAGDTVHYCLAGILVTDEQRDALESRADAIVRTYFPDREPRTVELKASWIVARNNQHPPWDLLPGPVRVRLFDSIRDLLLEVRPLPFWAGSAQGQLSSRHPRVSPRTTCDQRPSLHVGKISSTPGS